MVLFILVYFVAAAAAELAGQPSALSGSKIEMYPDGKIQVRTERSAASHSILEYPKNKFIKRLLN